VKGVGGDDAAARLRRVSTTAVPARLPGARRFADRIGDRVLLGLAAGASILAVAIIGLIIYEIVNSASPAISKYGLGFFGHQTWNNYTVFGAATLIFGTVVTSAGALLIAAPLGIAIGLYLSLFSARRTAAIIGPLVEMLAAVPSVIIGLWGSSCSAPSCARRSNRGCTTRSASFHCSARRRRPGAACSPR